MKICSKCGLQQSDNRTECMDCGEKLGKNLSKFEAEYEILFLLLYS